MSDAERIEVLSLVAGRPACLSVTISPGEVSASSSTPTADRRLVAEAVGLARLFTPARFNGLDGMPFPGPPHSFSTKDEVADYLETYAARFHLPVRTGVR